MPSREALIKAKTEVEQKFLRQPHVHTVAIGEVLENGVPNGQTGVVVFVDEKVDSSDLVAQGLEPLPKCMKVMTDPTKYLEPVRVDVQQVPQMKDQRLRLVGAAALAMASQFAPQGIDEWQTCHARPLQGGVQIAPELADWVGTLSCAVKYKGPDGKKKFGALTNYHVAVKERRVGLKIGQPSGRGSHYFATLDGWSPMTGNQNRVDAAVMDTWRADGPYAPGRHTVIPVQFKIGPLNPTPQRSHNIGDLVQKSGRTTGHTRGRVTAIMGTSQVDYGELGVLQFVDQTIVRGLDGLFSSPGDSGSLVTTQADNRPYGLLFAGGGGTTIINPIGFVMDMFEIEFFRMAA